METRPTVSPPRENISLLQEDLQVETERLQSAAANCPHVKTRRWNRTVKQPLTLTTCKLITVITVGRYSVTQVTQVTHYFHSNRAAESLYDEDHLEC